MWMPRAHGSWLPWEPGTSTNDSLAPADMVWMSGVLKLVPSGTQSFLKAKRNWTHPLPVPYFKHQATLCRQHYSSSFHTHNAVISLFPLPHSLSGKMLLVSFDGNSATQVKSLVLFLSFVVITTSEFNSAACFSAAVFAWQNTKELSTFLTYILLSRAYNLAEKMLTAEDQHSKSQCGGSISFQLWGKTVCHFYNYQ